MREKERMSPSRKKVTRLSSKLALFDFFISTVSSPVL